MSDPAPDTFSPAPPSGGSAVNRRRIAPIIVLVVAAVLGGLFWVLAASDSGSPDEVGLIDSPLIGRPAPAVRSTTIDDEPFDLARRKGLYAEGGLAARPGTSNHGWGMAVDANVNDPRTLQWLKTNGPRFGWVEAVPREPWHWEFRPDQV